jgi:hypothetical protein
MEQHVSQVDDVDPEGPACFLNQERICGPDCIAYLSRPPEGTAYLGEQWARCHLLVNADRAGRHLVVLASTIGAIHTHVKTEAADRSRPKPVPETIR